MNRRSFLRGLVGGIAITAAEPQWPFRVYSFAKDIITPNDFLTRYLHKAWGLSVTCPRNAVTLNNLTAKYLIPSLSDEIFKPSPIWQSLNPPKLR